MLLLLQVDLLHGEQHDYLGLVVAGFDNVQLAAQTRVLSSIVSSEVYPHTPVNKVMGTY